MRIGIDYRFAETTSGLGRYTRSLVRHLLKQQDSVEYILLQAAHIPPYSLAEQLSLPKIIRKAHIDLLFVPHFNAPLFCPVPFIITIHDLILHQYPHGASLLRRAAYRLIMHHAVQRARAIIAVSRFTAQELCTAYSDTIRAKLTVIPEGIEETFSPRSGEEQERVRHIYGLFKPFYLYIGTAKDHKNVQTLIDAFASIRDGNAELLLVIGGPTVSGLTLAPGVRVLSDVPEDDLPALYSAARSFVTASLYEGFCLPIVEARACGCPIIASERAAIPEIAGPHALLVEPTIEALANALRNPPPRSAPMRVCSWQETAEQTAHVLLSSK
jgi:alpha-1,3-rhamnosyl/mannosyltransferase